MGLALARRGRGRDLPGFVGDHPGAGATLLPDIVFDDHFDQEWLPLSSIGTILHSLRMKGLVARSSGCFKGAGGVIVDTENGWSLTEQGEMLAAAL
ncbi:MAG TPA: hypothetical protein VN752_13060 [Solirubrobacterales bacterium]|nr:hypothetical protein [Solirubrobacterales bacterium]